MIAGVLSPIENVMTEVLTWLHETGGLSVGGRNVQFAIPARQQTEHGDFLGSDVARSDATVTASQKPATLETGLVVNVPQFIEVGEVLRIDTEEGKYIERAK